MTPLLCAPVIAGLLPAPKLSTTPRPQVEAALIDNGLVDAYNLHRHYTGEDAGLFFVTVHAPERGSLPSITAAARVVMKAGGYIHKVEPEYATWRPTPDLVSVLIGFVA